MSFCFDTTLHFVYADNELFHLLFAELFTQLDTHILNAGKNFRCETKMFYLELFWLITAVCTQNCLTVDTVDHDVSQWLKYEACFKKIERPNCNYKT